MTKPKKPKQQPTGDYETGYCKPPAEHQFKAGQSGNPGGRPPKERLSNVEMFSKVMGGDIEIGVNGKKMSMPFLEALFITMRNGILKAKPKDQLALFVALEKMRLFRLDEEYRAASRNLHLQMRGEIDKILTPDVMSVYDDLKAMLPAVMSGSLDDDRVGYFDPDDDDEDDAGRRH